MRKTLSVRTDAAPKDNAEKRWKPGVERAERLKERAREERRHLTPAEEALWSRLSGAQMGGIKFARKTVVGSAIVDFACSSRWLVISITAEGASAEVATLQDRKLTEAGIRVLRFAEADVLEDLDRVALQIAHTVNEPFERPASARAPAPARPPRPAYGRGSSRQG
ncbi:MAG: hypothetical protein RIS94_1014 [Pseudomonadota bacterium]|jgi:very-short-patch-repair endonuclease